MLKLCVLVGLDWVEPMMFLLLHVTCSCIFHAYIPIFSFLLILTVFGTFMCVALSFFLSASLLYGTKEQVHFVLEPSLFQASTFDFTPSHVRFHDDKACKDFLENFSRLSIHLECQVVLSDFSNTDLPIVIYSRG